MISRTLTCSILVLLGSATLLRGQSRLYEFQAPTTDLMGKSCGDAGDVDGDGVPDMVIGVPQGEAGGGIGGYALVVSGANGSTLLTTAQGAVNDNYGLAVDGVGDVDGDGHSDLVIGGPRAPGAALPGYANLVSGATGAVLFTFGGKSADDHFGIACAGAGDVDGDGVPDVIVGASSDDTQGKNAGCATVYSGATGAVIWTWYGEAAEDYFGLHVDGAGDVDADGFADLIVGADWNDRGGNQAGAAYVFSGKTGLVLHTFLGSAALDALGTSVSAAGDLDADGHGDLLVGALGLGGQGGAIVFAGSDGHVLHTLSGDSWSSYLGWSVAGVGDTDGDGVPDLLVGDILDDQNGFESGAVWLYSGADGSTLATFRGEGFSSFGYSLTAVGDVNGDGHADFGVGAHHASRAWLYSGATCDAAVVVEGPGWPGTLGVPSLTASAAPVLGHTITLQLGNSLGSRLPGLALYGTTAAVIPTNRGGTLYLLPIGIFPVSIRAQGLKQDILIPSDSILCGSQFLLQVLEFDPGASHGVSFTDGLRFVIGGF